MPILMDNGQPLPPRAAPSSIPTANPPRRRVRQAARDDGHDAMNDALRGAVRRSTPETLAFQGTPKQFREQQKDAAQEAAELDARAEALGMPTFMDQGVGPRGAHRPKPADPSSAIRAAFRRGRGFDED
jgi:hypothetical protein